MIIALMVFFLVFLGIVILFTLVPKQEIGKTERGLTEAASTLGISQGGTIALINISGVISAGDEGGSLFMGAGASSRKIVAYLKAAEKTRGVKAILLRINSPGGTAAGSQEIYNEIMRIREKKPVIVSMADVAASGAYYISSAATKIVANPSTLTGSIGVIMESIDLTGLYRKLGMEDRTLKAGRYKDIDNPARPMTDEERVLLNSMLQSVYSQFLSDVAKGRRLDISEVKRIAEGRIYTGEQAKKLKLVDELGGFERAIAVAKAEAKIEGEPEISEYGKVSFFEKLFESSLSGTEWRWFNFLDFLSKTLLLSPYTHLTV